MNNNQETHNNTHCKALDTPYASSQDGILNVLQTSSHGLSSSEATTRLTEYGPNTMPHAKPPGIVLVFIHQFASPLIYVLGVAALFSIIIQEWSDALFIGAVLLINAIIGTFQEYSAQRAAEALQQLVLTKSRVLREGDTYEIDAKELVPGDIVLLESGDNVPADLRLLACQGLEVDESLLTGESLAVLKDAEKILDEDCSLGDRVNMAFAGTLVNSGRGQGVIVGTSFNTELGGIAAAVLNKPPPKAPLIVRMEIFTKRIALIVVVAALIMAGVALTRGMLPGEIFMLAVALAVSVIPEGLPVALTVALAISMRRMAKRNVIVRKLVAVESLGSCTYIAADKTGTLTMNQMTAQVAVFPNGDELEVRGDSSPSIKLKEQVKEPPTTEQAFFLSGLCQTAVLANEAFLGHRDGEWVHHGDAVDVALLVMAHKYGFVRTEAVNTYPEIAMLPFESRLQLSASLNDVDGIPTAFVKGAVERLLPMCTQMASFEGELALDSTLIEEKADELAKKGFRVMAFASGKVTSYSKDLILEEKLSGLTLVGLVGMIDPLRPEAKAAVAACQNAGIKVTMVTGDHPITALVIAKELELADSRQQIVTGPELKQATSNEEIDNLTKNARVFARVEPQQKLDIVQSLQRNGHFVAVSGDGANDAPALRAAQVGVAMGKEGTDVARETSELVVTDDNFASIVGGIEEGRVAYANVRKVIFLLISTGAAELVLFTLALLTGLPLPLLAVQLLWLNLVTNGIQDVALAFEPGEGNELNYKPRHPNEPIFNHMMIERVIVSALVIGCVAFVLFQWLLNLGFNIDEARNSTLLLMVLFENIHVFNCRSETRSAFRQNLLRNPVLLFGTLTAQLIHIGAMYTPWIKDVLNVQPVSLDHWLQLLGMALTVLLVMEIHKFIRRRYRFK